MTQRALWQSAAVAYDGAVGWIDDAVARLEAAGYREVPTELSARVSGSMRALRRSDFRVSWIFTRMHSFILLWEAPVVGVHDIRVFTADAVEWTRRTKGVRLRNALVLAFLFVVIVGVPVLLLVRYLLG